METVEVVIKLPKEVYEKIQQIDRIIFGRRTGKTIEFALWNGVKNGTVLPKEQGDLISRKSVLERLHEYFDPLADGEDICPADIYHEINALSGVIAADKEVDI